MAYQDVFVRITDTNGTRQSYSCRKKVNWVDSDMYFANGVRFSAMARYDKSHDECPEIDMCCNGVSDDAPVTINITDLIRAGVTLRLGTEKVICAISKAEELLKRIVTAQLSANGVFSNAVHS